MLRISSSLQFVVVRSSAGRVYSRRTTSSTSRRSKMSSPSPNPKKDFILKRKQEEQQEERQQQSKRFKQLLNTSLNTTASGQSSSENAPTLTSLDQGAFEDRLRTFRPLEWLSFNPVSPLECARAGWKLASTDLLKCQGCKGVLSGKLASPCDPKAFRKSVELLREKLSSAHHRFCLWATVKASASFCDPPWPKNNPEELLRYVLKRVRQNVRVSKALPRFSASTRKTIVSDDLMAWIQGKLRQEGGEDGNGGKDEEAEQCAIILTLTGWDVGGRKDLPLLQCTVCQRDCGTWMYQTLADPLPSPGASEEIFEKDPPSLRLGDAAKKKSNEEAEMGDEVMQEAQEEGDSRPMETSSSPGEVEDPGSSQQEPPGEDHESEADKEKDSPATSMPQESPSHAAVHEDGKAESNKDEESIDKAEVEESIEKAEVEESIDKAEVEESNNKAEVEESIDKAEVEENTAVEEKEPIEEEVEHFEDELIEEQEVESIEEKELPPDESVEEKKGDTTEDNAKTVPEENLMEKTVVIENVEATEEDSVEVDLDEVQMEEFLKEGDDDEEEEPIEVSSRPAQEAVDSVSKKLDSGKLDAVLIEEEDEKEELDKNEAAKYVEQKATLEVKDDEPVQEVILEELQDVDEDEEVVEAQHSESDNDQLELFKELPGHRHSQETLNTTSSAPRTISLGSTEEGVEAEDAAGDHAGSGPEEVSSEDEINAVVIDGDEEGDLDEDEENVDEVDIEEEEELIEEGEEEEEEDVNNDDSDSDVIEILSSDDDEPVVPSLDGMFDPSPSSNKGKPLFHPLNMHSHLQWCSWLIGLSGQPEVPGWRGFIDVLEKARLREMEVDENGASAPQSPGNLKPEESLARVREILDQA